MYKKIFILNILLFNLAFSFENDKVDYTAILIPPSNSASVAFGIHVPNELAHKYHDAETMFFNLLRRSIILKTRIGKLEFKKPDIYPYFSKSEPVDKTDPTSFVELPSNKITYMFDGDIPEYVIHVEDVHVFWVPPSESSFSSGAASTVGGIGVQFKYYIWNNISKSIVKFGICKANDYTYNPSISEWNDISREAVEGVFNKSNLIVKGRDVKRDNLTANIRDVVKTKTSDKEFQEFAKNKMRTDSCIDKKYSDICNVFMQILMKNDTLLNKLIDITITIELDKDGVFHFINYGKYISSEFEKLINRRLRKVDMKKLFYYSPRLRVELKFKKIDNEITFSKNFLTKYVPPPSSHN